MPSVHLKNFKIADVKVIKCYDWLFQAGPATCSYSRLVAEPFTPTLISNDFSSWPNKGA